MNKNKYLEYIKKNKAITTKELAEQFKISVVTALRKMRRLEMGGHVKRIAGWKYIGDDKNENE